MGKNPNGKPRRKKNSRTRRKRWNLRKNRCKRTLHPTARFLENRFPSNLSAFFGRRRQHTPQAFTLAAPGYPRRAFFLPLRSATALPFLKREGARPQVEVTEGSSFCSSLPPMASAGPAAVRVKGRRLSPVLGPAR